MRTCIMNRTYLWNDLRTSAVLQSGYVLPCMMIKICLTAGRPTGHLGAGLVRYDCCSFAFVLSVML